MHLPYIGDEVHHTGWNACSSCFDNPNRNRNRLIMPGLLSSRIYAVDVATDPKAPRIDDVSTFFLAIFIYIKRRKNLFLASVLLREIKNTNDYFSRHISKEIGEYFFNSRFSGYFKRYFQIIFYQLSSQLVASRNQ